MLPRPQDEDSGSEAAGKTSLAGGGGDPSRTTVNGGRLPYYSSPTTAAASDAAIVSQELDGNGLGYGTQRGAPMIASYATHVAAAGAAGPLSPPQLGGGNPIGAAGGAGVSVVTQPRSDAKSYKNETGGEDESEGEESGTPKWAMAPTQQPPLFNSTSPPASLPTGIAPVAGGGVGGQSNTPVDDSALPKSSTREAGESASQPDWSWSQLGAQRMSLGLDDGSELGNPKESVECVEKERERPNDTGGMGAFGWHQARRGTCRRC